MGMGGAQMAGGYGRGQYGYPQQAGQNKKPVGNHYSIMPLIVMDLSFLTHFHCFNFYSSVRVFFISAKASAYSTFVKTQLTECCDLNFAKPWFYLSFFFFFFFLGGGGVGDAIVLFPWTRNIVPHFLSLPRCIHVNEYQKSNKCW